MGLIKEFKEFIIKGNAVDLAVGLIIGAAFGAVITSLVQDVIMPPIGYAMDGIDFSSLKHPLQKAVDAVKEGDKIVTPAKPEVAISYGKFINSCIALLIQGFAIFMVVKVINSMKKKSDEAPAAPPADIALLSEIRDLLKKK